MFGALFVKECKQTAKSVIYWLVVGIMTLFFFTQLGSLGIAGEPKKGQAEYGVTYSKDEKVIMEKAKSMLQGEYERGVYTTYPVGFYKEIRLDENEQKRIKDIIEKVLEEGVPFEQFKKYMQEADEIIGGGSNYSDAFLKKNAQVPKTYEDAQADYELLVNKDHFTGGYARLFSDYMGLIAGILPIFLAVTRGLRDRRSKMQELIAGRGASAFTIIVTRYLSMLVMIMLPLIIQSMFPLMECVQFAGRNQISYDLFAFFKYCVGWLMPSVMAVLAVGTVLTELTDTAVAILVQAIWWFVTVFMGMSSMMGGDYGWRLIPRHNTEWEYEAFREGFRQLLMNRMFYVGFALVLLAVSIWLYSLKRKGRLDLYGKIFANRKRKSKV